MKRYLMRLGKTPFDITDGFGTFERNTIGGNNGNLIFGMAAHKLFSTADTEVDANHYIINKKLAERVNADYDGFILPLANAFRPSFEAELTRTTEFIEQLDVPFLMLSGGAQLDFDGDTTALRKIEPMVKRFARAVLSRSSALTVRGERTADYLRALGFKDVLVVGCPSMTMNGRGHSVSVPSELPANARIAYNIETSNPFGAELIEDAEQRFDAVYMPQDRATLEMMLWGTDPGRPPVDGIPVTKDHPQFTEAKAEYHLDAAPWVRRLGGMDLSFGARIHGNIAAILGGTPAVVFAHDSRTLELAQYHEIPVVDLSARAVPTTVEEVFDLADFTAFNRGHAERFDRLSDFIHANGFSHIYDDDQSETRRAYEERIAALPFPAPQQPVWDALTPETARMMDVLQQRHQKTTRSLKSLESTRATVNSLKKRLEEQDARLKAVEQRADLTGTTKNLARAGARRVRSVVKRIRPTR